MRTMGTMLIGNKLCLLGTIDADWEQVMLIGKITDLMLILLHERLGTHHVLDAVQLQPRLKLLEKHCFRCACQNRIYIKIKVSSERNFCCYFYLEAEGGD